MARLRYLQNKRSGAAGTISKSDKRIYFFDDNAYIYGSSSGVLNLTATTLDLNATTIDMDATTITLDATTVTLTGALEMTGDLTFTGAQTLSDVLTIGTRTAGTALSISTGGALTGINVGVVYDVEGVANTTDYIGTAAIFNYIHGVECKSGGNVTSGMATIWANYEIDYQVYGSGGLSAGWFTVWADAAADAAHIRSSAGARALHVQGVDIAIVSGAAFDLGSNCDLFGLRIDSSVDDSATVSGHFYGINIAKSSSGKEDWQIGVDISDSVIGLQVATCTTGIYVTGVFTNGISIVNAAATTSGRTAILVADTYTKTDGGVHKAISSQVTYTPATSGYSTPIAIVGKGVLDGNFTGGTGYIWGVQGQIHFNDSAILNNSSSIFAAARFVITADATPTFTDGNVSCIYCDNLCTYDMNGFSTTENMSSFISCWNSGGEMDAAFRVFGGNQIPVLFAFDACGGTDQAHMCELGAAKTGTNLNIAIDHEGTTYWIAAKAA